MNIKNWCNIEIPIGKIPEFPIDFLGLEYQEKRHCTFFINQNKQIESTLNNQDSIIIPLLDLLEEEVLELKKKLVDVSKIKYNSNQDNYLQVTQDGKTGLVIFPDYGFL